MAYENVCSDCDANLDPGEKCDCKEENDGEEKDNKREENAKRKN